MRALATEDVYDALIDDSAFAALPEALAAAYGGRSTMIHWADAGGRVVLGYAGCLTPDQLATYARDFADQDPWIAASLRAGAINRATDLEQLVPLDQFTRTAFYNEYLRPMGDDTVRCLGVMTHSRFGQGVVAIQRGASQHGYTAEQVAGVDALAPHLRRMLTIRGRLSGLERRLGAVQQMLDALPQAALLARADGRLVEANARAHALIADARLLRFRDGHIAATDPRQQRALAAALAAACAPAGPAAGAVRLGSVLATVSPVRGPDGNWQAMLLVEPSPPDPRAGIDHLKALHGLTGAEAAIALLLAEGRSVAEIGPIRGVTVSTLRKQLGAIAAKLGVSRQAEIVAVVLRVLRLG